MDDLVFTPAFALAAAIHQRRVSSIDALEAHLAQIARHNPTLNAIVALDEERARQRARDADAAIAKGENWGPLHGVPITLKDVHDTAGMLSTMGSAALAQRVATEDNVVAARLKSAGAILLGKTNAEISPDDPFGRTHSPWGRERAPGRSSSGAAAALAAGLTPLDIGSDLGGSIIVPSHYSGICGMRPTERRVPVGRFPGDPVAIWRTMMVLGPMARSVADLGLALRIIAGPDVRDVDVPPMAWHDVPRLTIRDLRIAGVPTFPGMPIAADIHAAIEGLLQELGRLGARVAQCLPEVDFSELARLGEQLIGLVLGAFQTPPTSLADYLTGLDRRDALIARWEQFFKEWDVLICPADMVTAPLLIEDVEGKPVNVDGAMVAPGQGVRPYVLSPTTGQPAVVIPLAKDRNGLPIGVQVLGRRWDDERLLAIAELLSEVTGGFSRPPGY
jgi:amidase